MEHRWWGTACPSSASQDDGCRPSCPWPLSQTSFHATTPPTLVQALGVGIVDVRPGLFGLARIDGDLMPVGEALARLADKQ